MVCSNGLLPDALMNTPYKNFAPRFGIAYSPDSKTVIRTGFGIFYSQDNSNSTFFDAGPQSCRPKFELCHHRQTGSHAMPMPFLHSGGTLVHVASPYAYSVNPNHHTAYTMQYLFNIQRQFGNNWSLEVGYLGSVSHHLAGFMNQNEGVPNGGVGTAASRLPFADFGFIQSVEDMGNAVYNSFAFKVTKRFSGGFSLTAAYTYASIDRRHQRHSHPGL